MSVVLTMHCVYYILLYVYVYVYCYTYLGALLCRLPPFSAVRSYFEKTFCYQTDIL